MNDIRRWIILCEGFDPAQQRGPTRMPDDRRMPFLARKGKDFVESAPPGKKAERFIKKHKKEFKKRYGKNWGGYLYGTAWKQFGEGASLRDYLSMIES